MILITVYLDEMGGYPVGICEPNQISISLVLHGEIIEDYPAAKPYPSCLIYGEIFSGDPVHSV